MHGEVDPALAVLPRAIERIDDPDASSTEPHEIVGTLLAEYAVVGASRRESRGNQLMRGRVGALAQGVGRLTVIDGPEPLAQGQQELPRLGRDGRGELHVGRAGGRCIGHRDLRSSLS